MTRKDYYALAAAIDTAFHEAGADFGHNHHKRHGAQHGVFKAALCIADSLAKDNPRFDRDRFLDAAGFPIRRGV